MEKNLILDAQAPQYWRKACEDLSGVHPVWFELIQNNSKRVLRSRGEPFETLLRSLVGQQISVKAADAVWGRLMEVLSGKADSARLLGLSDDSLRATGLSRQKVSYAKALSEFDQQGNLSLNVLAGLSDEDCSQHLCKVKGIGPWTAQMFLMFGLLRPDVWPVADLGVQKAISRQFFNGDPIGPKEALQFGEKLRPWRTVAAWYLWRSLDPTVVDY